MTPDARLQSVIDFLQGFDKTAMPADRALKAFFRTRRYAGSKDRAAISVQVFAVLRNRARLSWRMGSHDPRALVLASLIEQGMGIETVAQIFSGTGYGPPPLTAVEYAALARVPAPAPAWVVGEYPEFLEPELKAVFGDDLAVAMKALGGRASIDLRVNAVMGTRDGVRAELIQAGFAVENTPYSPWGLRLAAGDGAGGLAATPAYVQGRFEMQDESAQIASLLCAVRPGMRVLDFAAGAGGKTLALAAAMQNRGEIVAHDISDGRLHQLETRAARAGVAIVRTTTEPPTGAFDVVLLDAPCSGTGTWRRQPEQRWRLDETLLGERVATQKALLDRAATFVKPGGRLVYATCSVLPCENDAQGAGFLARHPEFRLHPASEVWLADGVYGVLPPGMGRTFSAAPHTTGTDGFFAAVFQAG